MKVWIDRDLLGSCIVHDWQGPIPDKDEVIVFNGDYQVVLNRVCFISRSKDDDREARLLGWKLYLKDDRI